MNHHLGLIFLVVVAAILVLVIVTIVILMTNGSKGSKGSKKKGRNKTSFYVPIPKAYALHFPTPIEKMTLSQLKEIARKIFESFRGFNYHDKRVNELDAKEWHSWQVSILLAIYSKNEDFIIYDQETIFHPFLLEADENDIKSLMTGIIKKYEMYVDFKATKDDLCRNYIWSSRDVSIIFYFLANFKHYTK